MEDIIKIAGEHSDHHERVTELEPAIIDSLNHTSPEYPTLEIGTQNGGSALLTMYHVKQEGGNRAMITVDVNPSPGILAEWADKWGVAWGHVQSKQRDFVMGAHIVPYGFVYLDADHAIETVCEDVLTLAPHMARGAIMAIDDVQDWTSLPDFKDVGLEPVNFKIDQGPAISRNGVHIIFFRKA
jgi:predicted O-methyltransferase YrrM